jgi:NADH dehydrogenase FAD-containing subunit
MSAIPGLPKDIINIDSKNPDAALRHILNNKEAVQANGTTDANGVKTETPWSLHEAPVENQRPLRVIIIGAGYSGIYLGIRIPERLRNVDLVIYEKNAGVGGTW